MFLPSPNKFLRKHDRILKGALETLLISSNLREWSPRVQVIIYKYWVVLLDAVLYYAFDIPSESVTYGRQDYVTKTPVGEPKKILAVEKSSDMLGKVEEGELI